MKDQAVKIKEAVQQYEDGLTTGWELYNRLNEILGEVDVSPLIEEHEQQHG